VHTNGKQRRKTRAPPRAARGGAASSARGRGAGHAPAGTFMPGSAMTAGLRTARAEMKIEERKTPS
jgi:hypothetical protein